MAPRLAWIGLGNMGRGMCKNLVQKAELTSHLVIFNRTTSRAESLSQQLGTDKTKVASSIEEAVSSSDIIFSCLGDDAAITETVDTALRGDVKGKLFVDCSTVHPDTTEALSEKWTEKGGEFVAAPVFGAPPMADSGQLVFVLAGPSSAVEKVKPYTVGVMGRANIDFSDQPPSRATHLKIIGNTFIFNMVETLAEGHVLAEKSGLGSENLHGFIEQMFPGPYTAYSSRMMSGDYHKRENPLFVARLARKDIGHATNLAAKVGVKMSAVEVADKHLGDVVEEMGERGDIAGIYGAVRKENGMQFEN